MSICFKGIFLSVAVLGLLATAPAQAQNGSPVDMGMADEMMPREPRGAVSGQFIIVLNDDVTNVRGAAAEMARAHGLAIQFIYANALKGFAAIVPEGRLNALKRDPRIAYVEQDQWGGIDLNPVAGVQRIYADAVTDVGGTTVIDGVNDLWIDVDVAVIDTGIQLDHPDLNVVGSTNCTAGSRLNPTCDDGNGGAGHWHGTHVAGTIAALDSGTDVLYNGVPTDVVGVAPGARLWAVRVLNNRGSGTVSQYIAGVDWVVAHAGTIEVANSSLGYPSSQAICDAVERLWAAGVTHAVSAGNDSSEVSNSPGNCVGSGGEEVVITVSAMADYDGVPGGLGLSTCSTDLTSDPDDVLASFSNYGTLVDVTAPGVCVVSTYLDSWYAIAGGTSMSSPHVAGAAALLAASGMTEPSAIHSAIVDNGNYDWIDDSLDGIQEPMLDVRATAFFDPATEAVGNTDSPPVASAGSDWTAVDSDDSEGEWVTLDGSGSFDPDGGDITAYLWTEGAAILGTVAIVDVWLADGPHNIMLTVTDDESESSSDEVAIMVQAPGGGSAITLTAALQGKVSKRTGEQRIRLEWTGATGTNVDVKRDGNVIATTANDGTYTDSVPATTGITYTYEVCETATSACSSSVSVNF